MSTRSILDSVDSEDALRRALRDRPTPKPGYLTDVIRELEAFHARILARRGGVPLEVDDILDEMKGRCDPGCS